MDEPAFRTITPQDPRSASEPPPLPTPPPRWSPPAQPHRPAGVVILAVLAGIAAVFGLLGALGAFVGGALLATADAPTGSALAIGTGGFLLVYALAAAAVAFGLLRRMRWAWTVAIVVAGFGLISATFSLVAGDLLTGILTALVNGIILWYLFRPDVREWFGMSPRVTRRSGGRPV